MRQHTETISKTLKQRFSSIGLDTTWKIIKAFIWLFSVTAFVVILVASYIYELLIGLQNNPAPSWAMTMAIIGFLIWFAWLALKWIWLATIKVWRESNHD